MHVLETIVKAKIVMKRTKIIRFDVRSKKIIGYNDNSLLGVN